MSNCIASIVHLADLLRIRDHNPKRKGLCGWLRGTRSEQELGKGNSSSGDHNHGATDSLLQTDPSLKGRELHLGSDEHGKGERTHNKQGVGY